MSILTDTSYEKYNVVNKSYSGKKTHDTTKKEELIKRLKKKRTLNAVISR